MYIFVLSLSLSLSLSEVYLTIKSPLGLSACADRIQDVAHFQIKMYRKSTHSDSKLRLFSEQETRLSHLMSCRYCCCKECAGKGVSVQDIDMVVHISCPKSFISYWQEAGRCARGRRQGYALIIYGNFTPSVKSTCKTISYITKSVDKNISYSKLLMG